MNWKALRIALAIWVPFVTVMLTVMFAPRPYGFFVFIGSAFIALLFIIYKGVLVSVSRTP